MQTLRSTHDHAMDQMRTHVEVAKGRAETAEARVGELEAQLKLAEAAAKAADAGGEGKGAGTTGGNAGGNAAGNAARDAAGRQAIGGAMPPPALLLLKVRHDAPGGVKRRVAMDVTGPRGGWRNVVATMAAATDMVATLGKGGGEGGGVALGVGDIVVRDEEGYLINDVCEVSS
jgi:hypothetical protein